MGPTTVRLTESARAVAGTPQTPERAKLALRPAAGERRAAQGTGGVPGVEQPAGGQGVEGEGAPGAGVQAPATDGVREGHRVDVPAGGRDAASSPRASAAGSACRRRRRG